jgi:hypothetical protein
MQNEQHKSDDLEFDFAEVWRTAHYRRADDIGPWLGRWLQKASASVLAIAASRRDIPGQKPRSSALV